MSKQTRLILGLDPGVGTFGYGLIGVDSAGIGYIAHGCITTTGAKPMPDRLRVLYHSLIDLKQRFAITDVAVEKLFYSKNASTAVAVGQARGVALLATVTDGVEYGEYTPTAIKQLVAGHGGATKHEVQQMVRLILGLVSLPSPDDAADALAVAICHVRQMDLNALFAQTAGDPPPPVGARGPDRANS